MNSKIKVAVADDNDLVRQMVVDSLVEGIDIDVVGEAADGMAIIDIIKEQHPDVVLLDLVMPNMDGMEVMETVRDTIPEKERPYFIIISAAGREEIVSQALQGGASYFLMKPFNGESLLRRVRRVFESNQNADGMIYGGTPSPQKSEHSTEGLIIELLKGIGVPVKMVGYKYLRDAIKIAIENPDSLMSVTKEIYPQIADEHGTSSGNVERNIRYVIETTWARKDDLRYKDIMQTIFKDIIKKPTNTEFVLICSEWIDYKMNH